MKTNKYEQVGSLTHGVAKMANEKSTAFRSKIPLRAVAEGRLGLMQFVVNGITVECEDAREPKDVLQSAGFDPLQFDLFKDPTKGKPLSALPPESSRFMAYPK